MNFNRHTRASPLGIKVGYVLSYFVFTTILFGILMLLNDHVRSWRLPYLGVMGITIVLALIGAGLKRLLE
ncbi:MAG: hypothetical protein H6502_03050 [Candidatus Woesearchaeota archaeon]|nr:MAG: hypothetical protein H6502_03050 [Candidatus Woesearchaeota archaeon]